MKPGTTLYFVRHGQTEWNRLRRIQGQIDTPLNATGRKQAVRNGQALSKLGLDLRAMQFVSSPLERCRDTIEIMRETLGLERTGYETDDRLKEINFGDWQGLHWHELCARDRRGMAARAVRPFTWRPAGGESYADLTARTSAWLSEVDRDTICVSHGGVSRALRGHLLGLQKAEVPELPVPQDKVLVLKNGKTIWI
jgi:broad specificity phosphatase PhoE